MRFLRVGLVAAACLALPSVASAKITTTPNGHRLSVMLRNGVKGGPKGSGGGVLLSHGGPVLKAEAPYLVYWTAGNQISPTGSASSNLLNQYLTDVAADSAKGSTTNVYSVLGQYGSPYSQTFSGSQVYVDNNPYPGTGCSLASGMTACVSDSSLRAEISKLITEGHLPSPTAPGSGTTPIFFVVTPVNVNVCTSTNSCVNNSFCAYHSYFGLNRQNVLYASVPFSVFATSTKGCQTDQYSSIYETPAGTYHGDEAYNVADDLSHELSETITDPLINAWYSKNGLEVGDLCEAYGPTADTAHGYSPLAYSPAFGDSSNGTLYDQVINRDQYYNQTEFSNTPVGCSAGLTALSG